MACGDDQVCHSFSMPQCGTSVLQCSARVWDATRLWAREGLPVMPSLSQVGDAICQKLGGFVGFIYFNHDPGCGENSLEVLLVSCEVSQEKSICLLLHLCRSLVQANILLCQHLCQLLVGFYPVLRPSVLWDKSLRRLPFLICFENDYAMTAQFQAKCFCRYTY